MNSMSLNKVLIILGILLGISQLSFHANETIEITGIVTDNRKEPLIFASVVLKSGKTGTQTDFDGRFSLEVPDENDTLTVSYVGYMSKEIPIGKKRYFEVVLDGGATLDQVVVTSYKVPLIKTDNTTQGKTVINEKIVALPNRNVNSTAATSAGIKSNSDPQGENQPNWDTEDYDAIHENRFHRPGDEPFSTFSIDVDRASYSNVRRFINNGQYPPIDAVRIEELINYFDYTYDQPTDENPFAVHTTYTDCPWSEENKLLHIGLQGKKISTENLPPTNLVFLLDVSGSMRAANKLPLVKSSMKLLLNQMRSEDRVAIVVYAGAAGLALPSTSTSNKTTILDALDHLEAGGSTAGGAGIKLAYEVALKNFIKGGNNRVILATDGDFNVGASSDGEMVRLIEEKRKSGVFLTVLGFGMGNYKDNKMQKLADKGNGNHAYIDNLSEARKVFIHEFGGTLFTIAKDVKIQIEFNPNQVQAYRLLGYENRMLHKEDFNDDKKDAGELGSGHVVTAIYEIIPVGVKSSFLGSVDKLKYQNSSINSKLKEVCTVKLRYKKPTGQKSILMEHVVPNESIDFEKVDTDVQFSVAVAEFGLILRKSEFKQNAGFEQAERIARGALGEDKEGYRNEFVAMVRNVSQLFAFSNEWSRN